MKTTGKTPQDRIAPAHVYQPRLGSGIEWLPGVAKLWEQGKMVEEHPHQTNTPYEFWHNLAFADCFETVTHWWFRSAWTQRVRLTSPQGTMDSGAVWGLMQFVDDQTSGQMYTIVEQEPNLPIISPPYPPNEAQPVNLPLRLALARLVAGVFTDEAVPNEWVVATSLVKRDELAVVFPVSQTLPFLLDGVETPLRQALCSLLGLKKN